MYGTDKGKKIKNMLKRYQEHFDEKLGVSLINDFLQLSHILEALRETDIKAFNAMYALISKNTELEEVVSERGSRIAKLQKGRMQP